MLAPRPTKLRSQRDVNLWRIPLQLSLAAVALFGITLIPDILGKYGVIHIPSWWPMGSIDDARAILSAMMGAVATVLALIFSVALLVLSMVSTLFGPRLLYRFLQDWVTQVTIGLFMGTFVYICLVFLVTHQDPASTFIPQISLIATWVLVVLSFGFLVFYSHRIARSIQNPDMIGAIVDDLYVAAGGAHVPGRGEGTGAVPDDAAILRQAETGAIVSCAKSGYLQHVDHGALVAAARAADALIVLRFRPGQFVLRGEPLAAIVPADNVGTLEAAIDRGVHIGRHRTLTQDSEFGIAQVVEIAIRALSPAVNDTFTGVACVDWLADALLTLAERRPLEGNWYDTGSRLRVWMPPVRLERLAKLAFDQIRQASATTPAVLIRQLEAIRRLSPRLPDACRQELSNQADAILETASALVALDRRDLDAAWNRAHSVGADSDTIRKLRRVYLLDALTDEELGVLVPMIRVRRFGRGEVLIRQGEIGDSFYVLRRGKVEVTAKGRDGAREERIRHIEDSSPESFFGEIALLTGEPRNATIRAASDVEVWEIAHEAFARLFKSKPDAGATIAEVAARRLAETSERTAQPQSSSAHRSAKGVLATMRKVFDF